MAETWTKTAQRVQKHREKPVLRNTRSDPIEDERDDHGEEIKKS
jgi:hypothetical protein